MTRTTILVADPLAIFRTGVRNLLGAYTPAVRERHRSRGPRPRDNIIGEHAALGVLYREFARACRPRQRGDAGEHVC